MPYGNHVSGFARQGSVNVLRTAWAPLVSSGSTPLAGRAWIKIFVKGKVGNALAIEYANRGEAGFTAPTTDVRLATIYPGMSYIIEPLGEGVNVYGRLVAKVGTTESSVRVIVTEFA